MKLRKSTSLFIVLSLLCFLQNANGQYVEQLKNKGFQLNDSLGPFYHGIASGDPLSTRVILWTRLTPKRREASEGGWKLAFSVNWQVATDSTFDHIVRSGDVATDETRDFTVKVDVDELQPNTTYYYHFEAFGRRSLLGITRTAPAETSLDPVKLAFVSGADYQAAYFNAYGKLATLTALTAIVQLGSYISYSTSHDAINYSRKYIPSNPMISLADFRDRYAQYHTDPNLMEAHRHHPFVAIWDDNVFNEDDNAERIQNAKQAFMEWLPIRTDDKGEPIRKIRFGATTELIMVTTHPSQSDFKAANNSQAEAMISSRPLLDTEQKEWVNYQLATSSASWKVLTNQLLMGTLNMGQFNLCTTSGLYKWDEYPTDRKDLLNYIRTNNIHNVLVATGNFNSSLGLEISDKTQDKSGLAVEFAVHSINELNYNESISGVRALQAEQQYVNEKLNSNVKYANLHDHGFVVVDFDKKQAAIQC